MIDLDTILRTAGARDGEPCLVEVARTLRGAASSVGYFWSTGRVGATVEPDCVRIRRRFGRMAGGNDLLLYLDDLEGLRVACDYWAKRRDEWAAFYFSTSGYPAGFGGAYWYEPPGLGAERVFIGSVTMGRKKGDELCGRDEVVKLAEPVVLSGGACIDAETWRRGEKHGPPGGSLVGVRYRFGERPGRFFNARREGGVVEGAGTVALEPGEESFIAALLETLRRGGSASCVPGE